MKVFAAVLIALSLSACSTVSGIGKDISGAADWTKEKMGGK
jgi:predicted small secreted protein